MGGKLASEDIHLAAVVLHRFTVLIQKLQASRRILLASPQLFSPSPVKPSWLQKATHLLSLKSFLILYYVGI